MRVGRRSDRTTLIATCCSTSPSVRSAKYTAPIPPWPRGRITRYGPHMRLKAFETYPLACRISPAASAMCSVSDSPLRSNRSSDSTSLRRSGGTFRLA